MRNYILLVVITALTVLSGCGKKSEDKSAVEDKNGSMTATINGEPFSAEYCTVGSSTKGGLHIFGKNATGVGRAITLSILNYNDGATGTYAVTFPNDTVSAVLDSNTSGQLARSGNITISKYSTSEISGTFSFKCMNGSLNWTVTEGVFKAVK
jgi:hypothetical protein